MKMLDSVEEEMPAKISIPLEPAKQTVSQVLAHQSPLANRGIQTESASIWRDMVPAAEEMTVALDILLNYIHLTKTEDIFQSKLTKEGDTFNKDTTAATVNTTTLTTTTKPEETTLTQVTNTATDINNITLK